MSVNFFRQDDTGMKKHDFSLRTKNLQVIVRKSAEGRNRTGTELSSEGF